MYTSKNVNFTKNKYLSVVLHCQLYWTVCNFY